MNIIIASITISFTKKRKKKKHHPMMMALTVSNIKFLNNLFIFRNLCSTKYHPIFPIDEVISPSTKIFLLHR